MAKPLSNPNQDYSSTQDMILVERVKAGPEKDQAFAELCRKYERTVRAIVGQRIGYGDHLRDVVQDVFLIAFQKIGQFRGDAPFRSWLCSIAKNRANDHLRSQRRHPREEPLESVTEFQQARLQNQYCRHEDGLELKEVLESAEQLCLALPEQERKVVRLALWDGYSPAEIAQSLGVAVTKVYDTVKAFRRKSKDKIFGLE